MLGQRARTRESRSRDHRRLAFVLALVAFSTLAASSGRPQETPKLSVVLLRPNPPSASMTEALLRIKSELRAGDTDVVVTDVPASLLAPEPAVLEEWAARAKPPSATLAIFGDLELGKADLWIAERLTEKAAIRRVEVQTSADRPISEVLAIRAQEVVRAMLVEVPVEENRPPPPAAAQPEPVAIAAKLPAATPVPPWGFAVELGGSVLGGSGGIGASAALVGRVRLPLDERFWLRLAGIGLGNEPRVRANGASATVGQSFLLLECAAWLRPRRVLRPMISLGAGVEHFAVHGSAGLPYHGEDSARWFFAADAGAGISVRLGAHWEAQLEAHALVPAPRPLVRFLDTAGARAGQPTFVAVLTVAGGG